MYPRHQLARAFKKVVYTTGNVTINGTAWTDLGVGDIVLEAQVDDVVEVFVNFFMVTTSGLWHYVDVFSIVSSSPVSSWSNGPGTTSDNGIAVAPQQDSGGGSDPWHVHGSGLRTVASGDLASGVLTLRPMVRQSSASNRTVYANTNVPFVWWAKNLGPVDPN